MKNINFASLILALTVISFVSCKNETAKPATTSTETATAAVQYICPMNCEKGKTYDKPGACPVCHMDLEPLKAETAANTATYYTAMVANPAQLEAGKAALLSFTPKIKGNENAAVPLDLVHEKKMHLILVNDDLSWFDHIHPEYSATGSYDVKVLDQGASFANGRGHTETRFDAGGQYWAFADFKPTGGLNQVDKMSLQVAGKPAKAVVYSAEKMRTVADGYTVVLEGKNFVAGAQLHIPVSISQGTKPVDPAQFENYLGEKAHVIMVETATKAFVHTHPAVNNGKLDIHTTFAAPGTYRGWLQFQTNGKVHTADFVVKVGQ